MYLYAFKFKGASFPDSKRCLQDDLNCDTRPLVFYTLSDAEDFLNDMAHGKAKRLEIVEFKAG